MIKEKPFGLYLFRKQSEKQIVLKELLQFLKTISPAQGNSFSYIGANNSLHPHLSLWENLQLEIGKTSWKDFQLSLNPEQITLVKLIKKPEKKVIESEVWEKFLVSLIKGLISPSKNLLIDMNEELISSLIIQNLKKNVLMAGHTKTVFLASANTALWLDCAHSLVNRKDYQFIIESLNSEDIKKEWIA